MYRNNRKRTKRELRRRNQEKPYEVRSRSPFVSKDTSNDSDSGVEFEYIREDSKKSNSNSNKTTEYTPMIQLYNCCINFPFPKIIEKQKAKEKLFEKLSGTDITDRFRYARVSVDWSDKHLQVVPGVNLLVTCKNYECEFFLNNVICTKGLYPERNGYCSMDGEIYRIKCPICKQRITPDSSIGIGFFRCIFKVSYMLIASKGRTVELKAAGDTLVFAKFRKCYNERFLYLDINVYPND